MVPMNDNHVNVLFFRKRKPKEDEPSAMTKVLREMAEQFTDEDPVTVSVVCLSREKDGRLCTSTRFWLKDGELNG